MSVHNLLEGTFVTPVRDIIFGPKRGEIGRVVAAIINGGWSRTRIIVEFERNGVMRRYSISASMVRRSSPLELLAEAAVELNP